MILRQIYKVIAFILLGFSCFIACGWVEVLLVHQRSKFLLDGFFYIPFACLSSLIPAYLGFSFLYKSAPRSWLLTVQKYIAVGLCAVTLGFLVSWNTHRSLMTTSVLLAGNGIAIVILIIGRIKIWKTN